MAVRKIQLTVILITLSLGLWWLIGHYSQRMHVQRQTRVMMDTFITIYAQGPKKNISSAVTLALNRMQEIGIKFNALNPKSSIYAFNQQGTPISDAEILKLINSAISVSKESNGAFDITIAPLVKLWGFYQKSAHLPADKQIKETLSNVGYEHLFFDNGALKKDDPGVSIDLGGIAKGYAISEAVRVLRQEGVTSALVDAGGDLYALGRNGAAVWRIGIRNPLKEGVLGYIEVTDLAVISSGDYERFFIQEGRKYHHIFDPKTGYPTMGVSAVTLVYPDPILAQAWAKIPFVLGPKKGLDVLEKIQGLEAIIVTDSGEILSSSGLKHKLKAVSNGR